MKKIKFILTIIIFITTILFTISINIITEKPFNNEKVLKSLIEKGHVYMKKNNDNKLSDNLLEKLTNINFKSSITFLENNIIPKEEKLESTYIEDPYVEEKPQNPIIYIYNTHQLEEYSTKNLEVYNIVPNVMLTSYILREQLELLGYPSIVEENDVKKVLNQNNWNYASSYKVSRMFMEEKSKDHPSLKYYIDLHRDSVGRNISTITINDRAYARVLFILGLENKNYENNLTFITCINNYFNKNYEGLSRGIYKKSGVGVNGVYNQDFNSNTILIEVGGVDNTIEEVHNTTTIIAKSLKYCIEEQNGI